MENLAVKEGIARNLEGVYERIRTAARRANRPSDSIQLVAVSKGQPLEKIRLAYELGLRDFGENRVYEAFSRQEKLADLEDVRWHMVGHIQSRKAKDLFPYTALVHSVDRMKIAKRLDRFSEQFGMRLPVLLECNVSGEESKYGWDLHDRTAWSELLPAFEEIVSMQHLEVRGLMTMAPWTKDEDTLRSTFQSLRTLRDYLAGQIPGVWEELSMGMTDDYEYAVEEGATILRIGRAIFGSRQKGD
jgi:pyridoxal phosphate enzyme (YggS family)